MCICVRSFLKNVDASSDVPIPGLGFAPHLVFSCQYQVLLVIQWRINCLDRDKQVGSAVLGTAMCWDFCKLEVSRFAKQISGG